MEDTEIKLENQMIEEAVSNINVNERVKDLKLSLNTAQSMQAEMTTKKINGILKALIISTTAPIQINISIARLPRFPFENVLFVIYENVDFKGEDYIPIMLNPQAVINGRMERMNFVGAEWVLNDKVRIFVKGPRNTNVDIIMRYIE